MNQSIAPGHRYQPRLGCGIEWQPEVVKLWQDGTVRAVSPQNRASAYDYFYRLDFMESFPQVSHWWFRSAWTQRARITSIQGWLEGGQTAWGYLQFMDEQTPAEMWTITNEERPRIVTPYPPNETQPANLPLRLALARLVSGVVLGQAQPDTWLTLTSLVRREDLPTAFPTNDQSPAWLLDDQDAPLRAYFCRLQGLGMTRMTGAMARILLPLKTTDSN